MRTLLLLLLLTSPLLGQETVIPDKADRDTCVKITTTRTSKFASIKVIGKERFIPIQTYELKTETGRSWVWTGPPDTYAVWVTFFDPDTGIQEDVGSCVVGNPPNPPDPPNPGPGGPYQIMMFYDGDQLDNYPKDQRFILTSLKYRKDLEAKGHVLLEVLEKAAISKGGSPFLDAVKGKTLPRIAFAPKDGGTNVLDYPLPANYEELLKLLNNPKYKAYFDIYKEQK